MVLRPQILVVFPQQLHERPMVPARVRVPQVELGQAVVEVPAVELDVFGVPFAACPGAFFAFDPEMFSE